MPCKFDRAKEALNELKTEGLYKFNPLLAMSIHGTPLKPDDYERRLAGALVHIRVTLSSSYFSSIGYQFYADIESIVILRPPKPSIAPPPSKSPSRRQRFALPAVIRELKSYND